MVVQTVFVELPQLQFIDSRRHFNCVAEAVVVPQVQLRLWTSLCSCSDGLFNSRGASDSVHRQSLWASRCAQRWVRNFQQLCYGGDEVLF